MNCRPRGEKTVYLLPPAHSRLLRHYYERLFLLLHCVPAEYRGRWFAGVEGPREGKEGSWRGVVGVAAASGFLSLPSRLSAPRTAPHNRCGAFLTGATLL